VPPDYFAVVGVGYGFASRASIASVVASLSLI
jgi:hypothetical protein